MRALQLLAAGGVPVPPTVMAANASDLKALVDLVGGLPVLIKLLTPSERPLVMVCESLESMEAALEAVLSMGHNLVVQRYVRRKRERDLRALVVGEQVIAWVERRPRPGACSTPWPAARSSSPCGCRPRSTSSRSRQLAWWASTSRRWTCSKRQEGRWCST